MNFVNDPETNQASGPAVQPAENKKGCGVSCLLVVLGIVTGLACAVFLVGFGGATTYESRAVFLIEERPYQSPISKPGEKPMVFRPDSVDHVSLIQSEMMVAQMMRRNDYHKLNSFRGVDDESANRLLQQNFQVESDPETPSILILKIRSNSSKESKLLLDGMIVEYKNYLRDRVQVQMNGQMAEWRSNLERLVAIKERESKKREYLLESFPVGQPLEKETDVEPLLIQLESEIRSLDKEMKGIDDELIWIGECLEKKVSYKELVWVLETEMRMGRRDDRADVKQKSDSDKGDSGKNESANNKNDSEYKRPVEYKRLVELYVSRSKFRKQSLTRQHQQLVERQQELQKEIDKARGIREKIKAVDQSIEELDSWLNQARTKLIQVDVEQLQGLAMFDKNLYRFEILQRPADGKKISDWPIFVSIVSVGFLLGLFAAVVCIGRRQVRQ